MIKHLYDRMQTTLERWAALRPDIPEGIDPQCFEHGRFKQMLMTRQAAWRDYVTARDEYHRAAWKKIREDQNQAQLP